MKTKILNLDNKAAGDVELNDAIFGLEPRADLIHGIADYYHLTPSPSNFLGAKGVGEAGTTGSMPTLMNAIIDAMRPLGIHHFDMPASSDRVWEVMRDARR